MSWYADMETIVQQKRTAEKEQKQAAGK